MRADDDSNLMEDVTASDPSREGPRHGFRGYRAVRGRGPYPSAVTVAISREAGSRGSSIGTRAGAKLGWPVYTQELLEYMAQEGTIQKEADAPLAPEAARWVDEQMERLLRQENISRHPSVLGLARVVLGLAVEGEIVLVGRGAGLVLPQESTLHARIIAPVPDRIAYLSQWLRLTTDEATQQLRQRDARRAEFLATHFHHQPTDLYQYDLILNSSLLGENVCAELIADAARSKMQSLLGETDADAERDMS
jgi:hypothetical protein